MELHSGLC